MNSKIARLIQKNLEFHALNKSAELSLGVSLVQYHVLVTLREMPGCSPQQLAEAVGMHPSTLTQSLKRLHRKGVLFMADDPRDARRKILNITRQGQQMLVNAPKIIKPILNQR
jgi:DNA-binding MarR family transcriptional regulator